MNASAILVSMQHNKQSTINDLKAALRRSELDWLLARVEFLEGRVSTGAFQQLQRDDFEALLDYLQEPQGNKLQDELELLWSRSGRISTIDEDAESSSFVSVSGAAMGVLLLATGLVICLASELPKRQSLQSVGSSAGPVVTDTVVVDPGPHKDGIGAGSPTGADETHAIGIESAPQVDLDGAEGAGTTTASAQGQESLLQTATCILPLSAILIAQSSGIYIGMRFTRVMPGAKYSILVAVLLIELAKLTLIVFDGLMHGTSMLSQIWIETRERPLESALLAIPALCYNAQLNLVFYAISHASATVVQALLLMKTVWMGMFSICLLGSQFSWQGWLPFFVLSIGVILVQGYTPELYLDDHEDVSRETDIELGTFAASGAAALTGFAGVFLEVTQARKHDDYSHVRNAQLNLYTIVIQLIVLLKRPPSNGLFYGFHTSTWVVIGLQASAGLVSTSVMRYAGKWPVKYAATLSLLATAIGSIPAFGYQIWTPVFWLGVLMVSFALVLFHFDVWGVLSDMWRALSAWDRLDVAPGVQHGHEEDVPSAIMSTCNQPVGRGETRLMDCETKSELEMVTDRVTSSMNELQRTLQVQPAERSE